MNKEQIDEFLEALVTENKEKYYSILGITERDGEVDEEIEKELLKSVITKIENENYEYFLDRLKESESDSAYKYAIVYLMALSSKDEKKMELIEKRVEYGLSGDNVVELIISRNDPDFIRECITNYTKYGLLGSNLGKLISSIEDFDLAREYIKNYKKYGLESFEIFDLILSMSNIDFIKGCIENSEEYGLEKYDVIELIKAINDIDFIKECIENYKEYGLDSDSIYELIKEINDPEYIKECIKKHEEYGLDKYDIRHLIIMIKDINIIKGFIEEKEEYGLQRDDIIVLINLIKNPELTKECIKNFKKYGLKMKDIESLIKKIQDVNFIKECIEKRKEYGFESEELIILIRASKDEKFIKVCIENREEYGFNANELMFLITATKDENFIKDCIKSKEKYGIDNENIVEIIKATKNPEFIKECLSSYKDLKLDKSCIDKICDKNAKVFLENYVEIAGYYKDEEFYEEFIRKHFGEVELDKSKNPVIPEDLKTIILNLKDDKKTLEVKEKLPEIIAKWELIKEQIHYKKANNIKNNGLEVRTNVEEILVALYVLNKIRPKNVSEIDFEQTPGSEKVGQDTQYTSNPEFALERAYELSRMMDERKTEKKYPDFSIERDGISLKVLHPQDKSAMLLGYETNCCFRPNGNADNSSHTKESLLQYCTTTPYGGVLKVEDEKNIYMGTPILANGNCLMFHSYETAIEEKKELVNELLVEAAKKAIVESKGAIKAVFMTDLHNNRVDLNNKIKIQSFFKAYTDGEYEAYETMYTNLDSNNVVLAIEVDGKILTGEESVKWYETECNSNDEIFKEKLGLKFGEIEDSYEYGKRKRYREIVIENPKVVGEAYEKYLGLKKERDLLALVNKKRTIEKKSEKTIEDEKNLEVIGEELTKYEEYSKYENLNDREIKDRLEKNKKESFNVFAGKNINDIAKSYGITEKDIEEAIIEKINKINERIRERQPEVNGKKQESGSSKQVRSKIISQIKASGNREFVKLIPKIVNDNITEEEMSLLSEAGIEDIEKYKRLCIAKEGMVDSQKANEDNKIRQIEKAKRDNELIESIVAEKIFVDISDEEMKSQIVVDLVKEIKKEIYHYFVSMDEDSLITDEDKEEIEQKIQDMNLETKVLEAIKKGIDNSDIKIELLEYGLNFEYMYKKISSDEEKIKKNIRKEKLLNLKSDITIGLKKRESWETLKNIIEPEGKENKNFERIIFGQKWYIGIGDKEPVVYIDEEIEADDKEELKEALKKEIEKEANKKKDLKISMEEMKLAVSEVSIDDKNSVLPILKEALAQLEK